MGYMEGKQEKIPKRRTMVSTRTEEIVDKMLPGGVSAVK